MTLLPIDPALTPLQLLTQLKQQASTSSSPAYAVFYADHTTLPDGSVGSWCGDTRAAEPLIEAKFGSTTKKDVKIVWAGDRTAWRDSGNVWRGEVFGIGALPTLVRVGVDGAVSQLVEEDVYDQAKLEAFVV